MGKFRLKVVDHAKQHRPFMRGIVIHSLVKRGMSFKQAYEIAQRVRDRLEKEAEITAEELNQVIEREVTEVYGESLLKKIQRTGEIGATIQIRSKHANHPYSKGLLAKSIIAAGIDPAHAYQMAQEMEASLRLEKIDHISEKDLYARVKTKLGQSFSEDAVRFFDLSNRINQLDRPVIIYLGGAGGTGKSTLATELASRLGIMKVTGTDMIRQIMRIVFTKEILPALHGSSFDTDHLEDYGHLSENERVVRGFIRQAAKVCVGVQAVVERAVKERMNVIFEGVHLLPGAILFPKLADKAYHIPVVLSLMEADVHRGRLKYRADQRANKRYMTHFEQIRAIHEYYLEQGNLHDTDIINNVDYDTTINELVQIVLENLQNQVSKAGKKE